MQKYAFSLPTSPKAEEPPENISSESSSLLSDLNTSIEMESRKPQTYPISNNAYYSQDIAFQEKLAEVFYARPRNKQQTMFLFSIIKNFSFIQTLCHEEENSSVNKGAVFEIVKGLKYLRVPQGKMLYKQDEISNNEIYIVFSGEVGMLVKKRDLITMKNLKSFQTARKLLTNPKSQEDEQIEEINPLLANFMESYVTSHEVAPNPAYIVQPRFTLTIPQRDHKSYNFLLKKTATLIKAHIIFLRGLRRRQKVFKDAASYGTVRDRITRGGYVGELRTFDQKKRGETALALTNCELLVVEPSVFEPMKEYFYQARSLIRDFIFETFPKLDEFSSSSVRESLTHALEEKRYALNNKITLEGNAGNYFYVIYSGQCEVSKEVVLEEVDAAGGFGVRKSFSRHSNTRKKVLLSTATKGVFFGEEILFSSEMKYNYSVRVISTKAVILAINIHRFAARFPTEVYEGLKEAFAEKENRYLESLKNILSSAPFDEFEIAAEDLSRTPRNSAVLLTPALLRKPLKLKKKKILVRQPTLLAVDDAFASTIGRPSLLNLKKSSSTRNLGVSSSNLGIGSINIISPSNRDDESMPDFFNTRVPSFNSFQEVSQANHLNTIPSFQKLDFKNGLSLQIPHQKSQPDLLVSISPPTELSHRPRDLPMSVKTPRRIEFKLEMPFESKDEPSLGITRTNSQPPEVGQDISKTPSNAIIRLTETESSKKNPYYRSLRESANNTPLSTSSTNSQIIVKKEEKTSKNVSIIEKNGLTKEDNEFDVAKSLGIKKGRTGIPSRFQELRKEKAEKLSLDTSISPRNKNTNNPPLRTLKTTRTEYYSQGLSPKNQPPENVRLTKLKQTLEKMQRMHLYSRSISHREYNLTSTRGTLTTPKDTTESFKTLPLNKIQDDPTIKRSLIGLSPKNPPSSESNRLKTGGFEEIVMKKFREFDRQESCLNTEGNEKKEAVKPYLFPMKDKKARRFQKSIALCNSSQEEKNNLLSPKAFSNNRRLETEGPLTSYRPTSKLEELFKKDVFNTPVVGKHKRLNTTNFDTFKMSSPPAQSMKKGFNNKERVRVPLKKISVHIE